MAKAGAPPAGPLPLGAAGSLRGIGARRRMGAWPREAPRRGALGGRGPLLLKLALAAGLLGALAAGRGGGGWRRRGEQRVGPALAQRRWVRVEDTAGGRGLLCSGAHPLEAELRLALDASPPATPGAAAAAPPAAAAREAWSLLERLVPPAAELARLRAALPRSLRRFGSSRGGDMVAGEPAGAAVVEALGGGFRELQKQLPAYPAAAFSGRGVVVVPRRAKEDRGAAARAGEGGRAGAGPGGGGGGGAGEAGGGPSGRPGGGLQHWADAVLIFASLRRQGCVLPGELWLTPDEAAGLPAQAAEVLEGFVGSRIRVLPGDLSPAAAGPAAAASAVALSSFEEVLVVDTDSVPVGDACSLFDDPGFRATGSLFWRDFWPPSPAPELFQVTGERDFLDSTHEGGQFLLDKRRAWRPLLLAGYMNLMGPGLYARLLADAEGGDGGKEALAFGFQIERLPRFLAPQAPEAVEAPHVHRGRRSVERYGRVLRRPADGRLLFLRQEGPRTAFFNLPDEPRGKNDDGSLRAPKYASHRAELREAAGFDVEAWVWTVLRGVRCDAGVIAAAGARARAPCPPAWRLYMHGAASPDSLVCGA